MTKSRLKMLLYFITNYKNISTRKPKYRRAVMRNKEFILYGPIIIMGREALKNCHWLIN